MKKFIVAKKLGMTQIFVEGKVIPVTVLEAGPCVVTQKKSQEKEGYNAIQIGFGDVSLGVLSKPCRGLFEKNNLGGKRFLKEFRLDDCSPFNVGDIVKVDGFEMGDSVDVWGISKGKGYAGPIKRWNSQRLKETHGTGPVHRHGGSLGSCSTPGRVMKGKKMAGHLGAKRVTVQNLKVVDIDVENNLLVVKGAVPGSCGSVICVTDSKKS
ncbi:MAG: 50S ribosomal protein L3 [Oscillospiraceae bacterium]|jgi:large subunit ribosomal protein L3|nr:50S ribosomal protein L3 [Oscillospiraceae bacterium]